MKDTPLQRHIDAWTTKHPDLKGTMSYEQDSESYIVGYCNGLVDARDIMDDLGPSHEGV